MLQIHELSPFCYPVMVNVCRYPVAHFTGFLRMIEPKVAVLFNQKTTFIKLFHKWLHFQIFEMIFTNLFPPEGVCVCLMFDMSS